LKNATDIVERSGASQSGSHRQTRSHFSLELLDKIFDAANTLCIADQVLPRHRRTVRSEVILRHGSYYATQAAANSMNKAHGVPLAKEQKSDDARSLPPESEAVIAPVTGNRPTARQTGPRLLFSNQRMMITNARGPICQSTIHARNIDVRRNLCVSFIVGIIMLLMLFCSVWRTQMTSVMRVKKPRI
jgi:hypothetical protein